MATSFPGLDVYEIDEPRQPGRAVVTRPNFTIPPPRPPGPSTALVDPKRPNFTMPGPQAAPTPQPGMGRRIADGLRSMTPYSAGEAAGKVVKGALPALRETAGIGLVGAGTVGALNLGRQYELDNRPKFEPGPTAPGQIPGAAPGMVAPKAEAGRFFDQTETLRNVGNAINALPGGSGVVRGVQSGLRGLGLARGADEALGAAQTGGALVRGMIAGDTTLPGTAPEPTTATAAAAEPAPYSNEGRTADLRTAPDLTGKIIRDGNSYSGKDIKAGADIVDPRGNLVKSGAGDGAGFGVSSLDTSAGYRADLAELARNASLRQAPQGPTMTGFGGTRMEDDLRAKTDAGSGMPAGLSARQQANFRQQQAELAQRGRTADAQLGLAAQGQNQGLRIAEMNNETQRRNADQSAAVSLSGQQVQREGQQSSARSARAQLQYEMAVKERDFATGRADKDFEQKQAREKNIQSNIEARFTTRDDKGNAVVDKAAAAQYRQGIDRAVARLGAKGLQELGPQAEEQLFAASDLLRTMKANSGILPWKPDALKTIDPLDLTGLKINENGDRVITREGKAMGQVIPRRFFETEEGNRFFPGTKTNRYDILSAQQ